MTKEKLEEKPEIEKKGKIKKFFKSLFGRRKEAEKLVEVGSKTFKPKRKLSKKEQKELNGDFLDAVKNNDINRVETYLKLGADVNIEYNEGITALMGAVLEGYADICKLLVENGADVNIQIKNGGTALMCAAKEDIDIVRYLLSVGANPLLKAGNGNTAYDITEREEVKQIIKAFENLWKRLGEKEVIVLIQNINIAIRECSHEKMYSIVANL